MKTCLYCKTELHRPGKYCSVECREYGSCVLHFGHVLDCVVCGTTLTARQTVGHVKALRAGRYKGKPCCQARCAGSLRKGVRTEAEVVAGLARRKPTNNCRECGDKVEYRDAYSPNKIYCYPCQDKGVVNAFRSTKLVKNNPMRRAEIRAKMTATMQAKGGDPSAQIEVATAVKVQARTC